MSERELDKGNVTLRHAASNGCLFAIGLVILAWGIIAVCFFAVQRMLAQ